MQMPEEVEGENDTLEALDDLDSLAIRHHLEHEAKVMIRIPL